VARSRFGGRGGRGGLPAPKRQIANDGFEDLVNSLTTVVGTAKVAAVSSFLIVEAAATIVRTRGELMLTTTTAQPGAHIRGAFGMIVASSDAATVGVTALPGPLSDIENDWFVWQPVNLFHQSATENEASRGQNFRYPFDSRGMRKVKAGEVLVLMMELASDVAGSVILAEYAFRVQAKL